MNDGDIVFEEHVQAWMRRDAPHTWLDPMRMKDIVYSMYSHGRQVEAEGAVTCKKRNDNVLEFVE